MFDHRMFLADPIPIPTRRTGILWLFIVLLALTACTTDDTYLPALLADPMASYGAEGIVQTDSWDYAQRRSFLGSAPVQAEVGRTYRIEDQSQAGGHLDAAVAFAEAAGWKMSQPLPDQPEFYRGTKDLIPGSARLSLGLVAADPLGNPDGPKQLTIHIEFHPVPEED
ncbi:MAG: hypothetical protein L0Z63_02765 [Actinobacteria bacterium]|nr:hypothetical protein [Actinomycetota bacterium]